ncbi:MAG: hypothetical protein RID53_34920 [Coleofasciculus sp. B1-GNL1-01]
MVRLEDIGHYLDGWRICRRIKPMGSAIACLVLLHFHPKFGLATPL